MHMGTTIKLGVLLWNTACLSALTKDEEPKTQDEGRVIVVLRPQSRIEHLADVLIQANG